MTETKHTPGPWHLCAHLKYEDQCSCGYRGVIYGPEGDGKAICQPGHEPAPEGQEFTEPQRYPRDVEIANAHLIAAAPDLLAALKKMLPEANRIDQHLRPTFETCEEARAAIAKAEGRS